MKLSLHPRVLLVAAVIVTAALLVLVWSLNDRSSIWPSLVTGFAATVLAFMVAFSWALGALDGPPDLDRSRVSQHSGGI